LSASEIRDRHRAIKALDGSIDLAAREISDGNNDLSQRTEHQAASLEETASSMEEITGAVKQNAQKCQSRQRVGDRGLQMWHHKAAKSLAQVVATMSSIESSSKKIVDIISVIDGIAFQTNILALNAAVEAARAGEQGRGLRSWRAKCATWRSATVGGRKKRSNC